MYQFYFNSNVKILNPFLYEEFLTSPLLSYNKNLSLKSYYNISGEINELIFSGELIYKQDAFNINRDISELVENSNISSFFYLDSTNIFNPKLLHRNYFFLYDKKKLSNKDEFNHLELILNRFKNNNEFKVLEKNNSYLISGFEEIFGFDETTIDFLLKLSNKYKSFKFLNLDEYNLPQDFIFKNLNQINYFAQGSKKFK